MIENVKYRKNGSIRATINGQTFTIPNTMSNRHRRMIAEWEREGNTIQPYEGPTLEQLKESAKIEIDKKAEEARLRFITPGAGQAQEYVETKSEALQIKEIYLNSDSNTEPNINIDEFPMIKAEFDAMQENGIQTTVKEMVDSIIQNEITNWKYIGSEIKRIRRSAKIAVNNADYKSEVQNILDNLQYPTL